MKMKNNSKKEKQPLVLPFNKLSINDVSLVGGKNASLGEMYQELTKKGINIPNGFATTSDAYRLFIKENEIEEHIRYILKNLNTHNTRQLIKKGKQIRTLILNSEFPEELEKQIIKAYKKLSASYNEKNTDVAVRSSATAEDLPNASFAGQQETFLNIRGEKELLKACKKCFASLFTNRAISYRVDKKFSHFNVALSIGIQKMVRSDLASSGVMFSIDTETGFENVVLINSIYGLGENIVQGKVNPDEFYVHKPTLKKGYPSIISRRLGNKKIRMIYNDSSRNPTKNISVSSEKQKKFSISSAEVLKLARWAIRIEQLYEKPMDIEWAKDGKTNKLFIVQARPETVQSQKDRNYYEDYYLKENSNLKILTQGKSVGSKIASGKANIIKDVKDIHNFKKGQVLVTDMTDPDWEPIMKIASAIVTNKGGRTCHAAIVSRELGIPAIVGTNNATQKIKQKQNLTIDCTQGETGYVYSGICEFGIKKINLKKVPKIKTPILMNIGTPEQAFEYSFLPNEGVGLAREEFIINSSIKIHPNALIDFKKLKDKKLKNQIEKLTPGYNDKTKFYINKLSEGIARIAAAFYPKKVILRLSDFKTNEYRNLIGGNLYEPEEQNPMLGFRGASRYYSPEFQKAFSLECQAIKKVRKEYGLKNLKIMVPFCRTINEAKKVISLLSKNGLKNNKDELEIFMMVEIPSNVLLIKEFSKYFNGFSIGSNDLTQLTLGLDRDSEIVTKIADERDLAVKKSIRYAIKKSHKHGRVIGICGQAPSDFPDFAKFLIKNKIDYLSLNPDSIIPTLIALKKK
jgi:pyruvate, water dikinase